MRIVFFISFLGILLNFSSSYNAYAEPICSVSEEKKALIKEALCGKFSSELEDQISEEVIATQRKLPVTIDEDT